MSRRIAFMVEGIDTLDGRYVAPGALKWVDPMPIRAYVDGAPYTVGRVTDITREGNLIVGTVDVDGVLTADVDDATITEETTGHLTIENGTIVGLMRADRPNAWPWPDHPQEQQS